MSTSGIDQMLRELRSAASQAGAGVRDGADAGCNCQEHRTILAALKLRDGAAAGRAMLSHLARLEIRVFLEEWMRAVPKFHSASQEDTPTNSGIVWSPVAVSSQVGGMALLKALLELEPSQIDITKPPVTVVESPKAELPVPATTKVAVQSVTNRSLFASLMLWIESKFQVVQSALPLVQTEVTESLNPIEALARMARANLDTVLPVMATVLIVVALYRHTRDKKVVVEVRGDSNTDPKGA
jgi:hypothetical protein